MADKADVLGLLRADGPGGEQQLHGDRERDLPREAHRRPALREQTALGLEDPERGGLARDPDVGGLKDLAAARDRVALDRGDQRLRQVVVAQQRLPVEVRVGLHPVGEARVRAAA